MSYEIVKPAPWDVRLRSVLHAVGMIGGAFLVGIALAIVGMNLLSLSGYSMDAHPVIFNVVGTVLQFVGFIVAVLAYLLLTDNRDLIPARVPGIRDVAWMIAGFVGVSVAAYAVSVVISMFGLETAQNAAIGDGLENPEFFLYLIPIAVLLVGPGEELVFRGVVQGKLTEAYGPVLAIPVASVLFGAVHVVALTGGTSSGALVYIAVASALGVVLGVIYEMSDNIVVPAVVHGLWNAMLFGVWYYVAVTGLELPA